MANDRDDFWEIFERAKREVDTWPDWKKEIRVSLYTQTPELPPSRDKKPHPPAKK